MQCKRQYHALIARGLAISRLEGLPKFKASE
jgi:hypothetical protein